MRIHGVDFRDDVPYETEREIEYIHRWTKPYRKAVISKFYQLEEWYKRNPTPITLLTLTTYQDGDYSVQMKGGATTIQEAFKMLKQGWYRLSNWIRKYHPEVKNYITIMEPHKSGYPHLHVILFGTIPEESQKRIRNLWSKKYQAGDYYNGVDFSLSSPKEGIKSIRNYLIKYIAKTLQDGKTGTKFNIQEGWSPGELLFNAVMWKNKYRLWGASAELSRVMARKPSPQVSQKIWTYTELIDENGESHILSKLPDYPIPNLIETGGG